MGSNVKKMTFLMVVLMFAAIAGIVIYDKWNNAREAGEAALVDGEAQIQQEAEEQADRIGDDTRAFLQDETFFDPDKPAYSSIEIVEGNHLSLLMTSVEKDLRIQIVDSAGNLVTGQSFCVVLNKKDEYVDDDQDGVIYIDYLRSGDYAVGLKEVAGYQVPSTEATITVKQNVEYVAIEDIQLLILTEKDINPELEDAEVNGAQEDADASEITGIQEGNVNARFGIDVSKWNKEIDWDKVRNAGVEYAVIRVGYRGATTGALIEDPYFEQNIKGAAAAGIPVGVYFFTQALNEVEAVEEASMVIQMCRDYDITYPVFIDSESTGGNGRADALDADMRTRVCEAFCQTVEGAGYRAGVYASRNWFNEMLDMDRLEDYIVWLAEYRDVPLYQGYYHMWQYTSGGSVDGIEGRVDFNLSYLKQSDLTKEEEEKTYTRERQSENGIEIIGDVSDTTATDTIPDDDSSTAAAEAGPAESSRTTAAEVEPTESSRTTAAEGLLPEDDRTAAY